MIRSVEQLKKRLDLMIRDYGAENIILDHGSGSYSFSKYLYYPKGYDTELKKWRDEDMLVVFCKIEEKEQEYLTITNEELRKPKGEYDYCHWFVHASWEKKYPKILNLSEYEFKEWMEKCGLV